MSTVVGMQAYVLASHQLSVNTAAAVLDPTRSLDEHSSIDHALYELSLRDTQRNGPLSQSLLCCLPPPDEVQVLFDGYVEDMNALRYPFVLEPIRRCMNRIPDMLQRGYIATDEVSSFAVVAAMLSQAVLRTERHDIVPRDITTIYMGARKLVFACMKALCVSDILGRMDFEKCLALHLAARFLLVDRRINEAWVSAGNAVRCAQSIGLHRYESIDRPHREAEESRVLWCSLRYDERSFSVMLDRPSSIDDNLCTTRPPPASATLATEDAEFVGWRHELATFQGRILSLLQGSPKGVSIREVLSLDEEIAEFRRTLPGDDTNDRNRFVQRFVIHSHTLQARTALLRPFFLRTIPRNAPQQVRQRHLACRRRCVEAACEDLALREYLVKEIGTIYGDGKVPSPARNHIRTPRWFTTLVICGAYLLTCNPHSIDGEASEDASMAQKAREHLQTFIGLAEEKQRSETSRDAALDREVSIVSMFLEKSSIANPQNENGKRARDRTASVHGSAVSHGTPTAHSTPGRPIANGDSGSNRASSDVGRQGEDLQVIFDAWFQSDFNNINANDIPSVFEVPSTAAISALPTSAPSMPGPTVAMVQQQHQQQQQGHRQERQQQQVQMQEQPNLMSPSQNQNGMQGGEFWQGCVSCGDVEVTRHPD